MRAIFFLIVTAVGEGCTGLVLLFLPAVLLTLLLGESSATPEATFLARFFGAALFAFGVACWLVRNRHGRPSQLGLLIGAVIYDVAAAALLAYLGQVKGMAGIALWPAVLLHSGLAVWGGVCVWDIPRDGIVAMRADLKPATAENELERSGTGGLASDRA